MKEDISIWLYGSNARGDSDLLSDVDILVIGESIQNFKYIQKLIPKGLKISDLNFYSWKEIKNMAKYGSLFLHHLKLEGKCIYEGRHAKNILPYLFSKLGEYKKASNDLKSFSRVIEETKQSLILNDMLIFDLSVLATVIRHCSILGCWFLGRPCFKRIEPVSHIVKELNMKNLTVREYSDLYKYKLYVAKRIDKIAIQRINISPKKWIENSEIIINGVEGIING